MGQISGWGGGGGGGGWLAWCSTSGVVIVSCCVVFGCLCVFTLIAGRELVSAYAVVFSISLGPRGEQGTLACACMSVPPVSTTD